MLSICIVDVHIEQARAMTSNLFVCRYYETGKLTERSDVYAFGVVLMEILTAQNQISIIHIVRSLTFIEVLCFFVPNSAATKRCQSHNGQYFFQVSTAWKSNQLDGLADPKLLGLQGRRAFSEIVKLSLWCTRKRSSDRPSMPQVVQRLREIGMAQAGLLQSDKPRTIYTLESETLQEEDLVDYSITMPFYESSSSRGSIAGRLSSEIESAR